MNDARLAREEQLARESARLEAFVDAATQSTWQARREPLLTTIVARWPRLSPEARAELLAIVMGENHVSVHGDTGDGDSIAANTVKTALPSPTPDKKRQKGVAP